MKDPIQSSLQIIMKLLRIIADSGSLQIPNEASLAASLDQLMTHRSSHRIVRLERHWQLLRRFHLAQHVAQHIRIDDREAGARSLMRGG